MKNVMNKGVIYIITNTALTNQLKIGYTSDIEQTLKELNKKSKIKGAYNVYATYETGSNLTDNQVYKLLTALKGELGTVEVKRGQEVTTEYIEMKPEDAYKVFKLIAKVSGTEGNLHKVTNKEGTEQKAEKVSGTEEKAVVKAVVEETPKRRGRAKKTEGTTVEKVAVKRGRKPKTEERAKGTTGTEVKHRGRPKKAESEMPKVVAQAVEETEKQRTRKPNLKFSDYNIPIGSMLEYVRDRRKRVKVIGEREVEYNGDSMSMSECAKRLLNSKSGVQGTNYFSYNGKRLSDIRKELGL